MKPKPKAKGVSEFGGGAAAYVPVLRARTRVETAAHARRAGDTTFFRHHAMTARTGAGILAAASLARRAPLRLFPPWPPSAPDLMKQGCVRWFVIGLGATAEFPAFGPDGRACSAFYPVALPGRQAGAGCSAARASVPRGGTRQSNPITCTCECGMPLVSARTRDLTHRRSGLELEGRTTT